MVYQLQRVENKLWRKEQGKQLAIESVFGSLGAYNKHAHNSAHDTPPTPGRNSKKSALLQCVVVCCSVLQCVAHCSAFGTPPAPGRNSQKSALSTFSRWFWEFLLRATFVQIHNGWFMSYIDVFECLLVATRRTTCVCVTWLIHVCDMTHPCVW